MVAIVREIFLIWCILFIICIIKLWLICLLVLIIIKLLVLFLVLVRIFVCKFFRGIVWLFKNSLLVCLMVKINCGLGLFFVVWVEGKLIDKLLEWLRYKLEMMKNVRIEKIMLIIGMILILFWVLNLLGSCIFFFFWLVMEMVIY